MTLAEIIAGLLVLLAIALALAYIAGQGPKIALRREQQMERAREKWAENSGDQGGMPMPSEPGDEFYAKRRAGDMDTGR